MCFWRVRVCVCMYVTHQGRHQSQVEPVPVAAARADTVPWATAARRSAPDAPALAGSLPLPPALARSLSLPPAPARMGDGFSNSASARVSDKGGHLASRDVRLPEILLWMVTS